MKKIFFILIAIISLSNISLTQSRPRIDSFAVAIRNIVTRYYPNAIFTQTDSTMKFEFNTRDFYIHFGTKNGIWQEACKVRGPNKGGIYGEIMLRIGEIPPSAAEKELGKGGWPILDQYYFDEGDLEYYSKSNYCYLVFILRFTKNMPIDIMNELKSLSERFEDFI